MPDTLQNSLAVVVAAQPPTAIACVSSLAPLAHICFGRDGRLRAALAAIPILVTPHPRTARFLLGSALHKSGSPARSIVKATPMYLAAAIARSASHSRCRLFLVASNGRIAGRAGAALAASTPDPLDIAGSAIFAGYTDAAADRLLDRIANAGAHYALLGLPDAAAIRIAARAQSQQRPFCVVAVGGALSELAA